MYGGRKERSHHPYDPKELEIIQRYSRMADEVFAIEKAREKGDLDQRTYGDRRFGAPALNGGPDIPKCFYSPSLRITSSRLRHSASARPV